MPHGGEVPPKYFWSLFLLALPLFVRWRLPTPTRLAAFGHVPPQRDAIDTNGSGFQALGLEHFFVLRTNGVLGFSMRHSETSHRDAFRSKPAYRLSRRWTWNTSFSPD